MGNLGSHQEEAPASNGFVISPNNSADLDRPTRGIYVGGAGNIVVTFLESGEAITITGVLAGTVYPFRVRRVYSTGTTATSLVGLY